MFSNLDPEDPSVAETEISLRKNLLLKRQNVKKIPIPNDGTECQKETESSQGGQKIIVCLSKYSLRNGYSQLFTNTITGVFKKIDRFR